MNTPIHEHYDHYNKEMIYRLDGFYGKVDASINARIASMISGNSVLDLGCGFGSLVSQLTADGYRAVGIDLLDLNILSGKLKFPNADLRLTNGDQIPSIDKSFESVILKDVMHHLVTEPNSAKVFSELKRVCGRRVIVIDPNPTPILLFSRRIIGHVDPVCTVSNAVNLLVHLGYQIKKIEYSEVIAFPLSGGYVGYPFVPNWKILQNFLMRIDSYLLKVLRWLSVDRFFCWRYYIVADIP